MRCRQAPMPAPASSPNSSARDFLKFTPSVYATYTCTEAGHVECVLVESEVLESQGNKGDFTDGGGGKGHGGREGGAMADEST